MSEEKKLNLEERGLKKFGITMGIAFLVITAIFSLKHRTIVLPTAIISLGFFFLGLTALVLLKPVYIVWMKFAHILAWINTRLILTVLFYLLFTPIGIFMKLFGKDLLDRKVEKGKHSYWHKKESKEFDRLSYERQF